MSLSNDKRLLDQSARALRTVADWINDLDTVQVDGRGHDALGELIFAVDEALALAEVRR